MKASDEVVITLLDRKDPENLREAFKVTSKFIQKIFPNHLLGT